jgi:hypothetical protein
MRESGDHVSDLITPYVLGAVEPDEIETVESHLADYDKCRTLVDEEHDVAGLLPYLSELLPGPIRVRRKLLDQIRGESQPAPFPVPIRESRRPTGLLSRLGWVAAVPAMALAILFFVNGLQMQAQVHQRDTELSVLEQRQSTVTEFVSSSRGTEGAPRAHGGLLLDPNRDAALLIVTGLTSPLVGQSYVVWMIKGNQRMNAGVMPVVERGRAQIYIPLPQGLDSFDNIILTAEAQPTVANPNGTILMAAKVGA